jgi:hypothetical protein
MSERDELSLTSWTLGIATLAIALVIVSIIWTIISARQLQVVNLRPLSSYIPVPVQRISDLRYSSSGGLVAAVENSSENNAGPWVDIYIWDSAYQPVNPPVVTLDFGQLTGEKGQPKLVPPFTAKSPFEQSAPPAQADTQLPYAFSDDGSMVAWSWKGKLFVGPLQDPKKFQIPLNPSSPVVALSFFAKDLIGVIHIGGQFRLERFPARDPLSGGTELKGAWRISGQGPFRVLSSFAAGDASLVKTAPRPSSMGFPVSAAGTFISASKMGKVATGTAEGLILFDQPFEPTSVVPRQVQLPERLPIQTLVFLTEQSLIASIDGGGLFLVNDEQQVISLVSVPLGVRLMAVDDRRIAMVTPGQITVADLQKDWVFEEKHKLWLALTFYILSFLALVRLGVGDGLKIYYFKRELEVKGSAFARSQESEWREKGGGFALDQLGDGLADAGQIEGRDSAAGPPTDGSQSQEPKQ